MDLIVGLGNPGEKYKNNRHNVGFQFIDYVLNSFNGPDVRTKKNPSSIIYHLTSNLVLAKPLTFMNRSGRAIKQLISNFEIRISNLIVVHDDLDIPLGKFRIDFGRGPKLHNGLSSIETALKTKEFYRVRIGVDNRQKTGPENGETYVLKNFLLEELTVVNNIFPDLWNKLKTLLTSNNLL